MDEELIFDKSYISSVLKNIVSHAHTNPLKMDVHEKESGGFQIACPYCGDSEKNPRNYRGNLNEHLFYKCFNCDKKTHFITMCADFSISIDAKVKVKIYDYLDKHTNKVDTLNDEILDNGLNHLISLSKLTECINKRLCESDLSNFKPIEYGSAQYFYLIENRGLTPELFNNIYQADYHITGDWYEKVIVYLNRKGDKLLGAQVRNLKEGKNRLFDILTFSKLYEMVGDSELSEVQLMMYNKLSYYYGILEINFYNKITIFEGYGDALLFPNAIGLAGVNTDIKFLESNDLDIRFFYDNDNAGNKKSEEKIKIGFSCFLWNKMFDYVVDRKNSTDPYYHRYKISKIIDLTKLNKVIPEVYEKLQLEQFFSIDKRDLKYIPKHITTYKKQLKK